MSKSKEEILKDLKSIAVSKNLLGVTSEEQFEAMAEYLYNKESFIENIEREANIDTCTDVNSVINMALGRNISIPRRHVQFAVLYSKTDLVSITEGGTPDTFLSTIYSGYDAIAPKTFMKREDTLDYKLGYTSVYENDKLKVYWVRNANFEWGSTSSLSSKRNGRFGYDTIELSSSPKQLTFMKFCYLVKDFVTVDLFGVSEYESPYDNVAMEVDSEYRSIITEDYKEYVRATRAHAPMVFVCTMVNNSIRILVNEYARTISDLKLTYFVLPDEEVKFEDLLKFKFRPSIDIRKDYYLIADDWSDKLIKPKSAYTKTYRISECERYELDDDNFYISTLYPANTAADKSPIKIFNREQHDLDYLKGYYKNAIYEEFFTDSENAIRLFKKIYPNTLACKFIYDIGLGKWGTGDDGQMNYCIVYGADKSVSKDELVASIDYSIDKEYGAYTSSHINGAVSFLKKQGSYASYDWKTEHRFGRYTTSGSTYTWDCGACMRAMNTTLTVSLKLKSEVEDDVILKAKDLILKALSKDIYSITESDGFLWVPEIHSVDVYNIIKDVEGLNIDAMSLNAETKNAMTSDTYRSGFKVNVPLMAEITDSNDKKMYKRLYESYCVVNNVIVTVE